MPTGYFYPYMEKISLLGIVALFSSLLDLHLMARAAHFFKI
jgi:hypothetical protein